MSSLDGFYKVRSALTSVWCRSGLLAPENLERFSIITTVTGASAKISISEEFTLCPWELWAPNVYLFTTFKLQKTHSEFVNLNACLNP